jgi:hypothetical protein
MTTLKTIRDLERKISPEINAGAKRSHRSRAQFIRMRDPRERRDKYCQKKQNVSRAGEASARERSAAVHISD